MKNALFSTSTLLIITTIFCVSTSAQIAKGTFRIGPDINFTSSSTEFNGLDLKLKSTSLNLGTQAGFYIINNLELGVGLSLTSSKTKLNNTEQSSNGIAIGPVLEYKIGLSSSTYFTFGGGVAYNSATNQDENGIDLTYTGLSYRVYGSVEYIINNKLGAFIGFGPEFGTLKDSDSNSEFDVTTFGIATGFGFYF